MQIVMCWVALYIEWTVGKYVRINEAGLNKKMRKKLNKNVSLEWSDFECSESDSFSLTFVYIRIIYSNVFSHPLFYICATERDEDS